MKRAHEGYPDDCVLSRKVSRGYRDSNCPLPSQGTPLKEGQGADPAKFEKAVKAADKLGDTIAKTTDKIMEMRKDLDEKQVIARDRWKPLFRPQFYFENRSESLPTGEPFLSRATSVCFVRAAPFRLYPLWYSSSTVVSPVSTWLLQINS